MSDDERWFASIGRPRVPTRRCVRPCRTRRRAARAPALRRRECSVPELRSTSCRGVAVSLTSAFTSAPLLRDGVRDHTVMRHRARFDTSNSHAPQTRERWRVGNRWHKYSRENYNCEESVMYSRAFLMRTIARRNYPHVYSQQFNDLRVQYTLLFFSHRK